MGGASGDGGLCCTASKKKSGGASASEGKQGSRLARPVGDPVRNIRQMSVT